MISCTSETESSLRNYGLKLSEFLDTYEWMTEAYVSDFFFKEHWKKLPDSWQKALPSLSTGELSGLVDRGKWKTRHVLPLSLLSFASCTKALSLDRSCGKDFRAAFDSIFDSTDSLHSSECEKQIEDVYGEKNTITKGSQDSILNLQDCDGKLHAFFRKHVKPKKQHEILNLGEVIKLLCDHTECNSVVDVGAGLGHLSRLLSFGHGLKVTSVEAAGTHAPKANKYDREIDRELKKKNKKAVSEEDVESCFPCHVTSMIYPDTSVQDFLAIVNSQRQADIGISDQVDTSDVLNQNDPENASNKNNSTDTATNCQCEIQNQISRFGNDQESCDIGTKETDKNEECLKRHCKRDDFDLHTKIPKLQHSDQNLEPISKEPLLSQTKLFYSHSPHSSEHNSKCSERKSVSNQKVNDNSDIMECEVSSHSTPHLNYVHSSGNQSIESLTQPHFQQNDSAQDTVCDENQSEKIQTCSQVGNENDFILTGLHACGDLTPTFLRFFVNCEIARGLASVGCCYMKITDTSVEGSSVGYPMSQAIKALPHHRLTYNARELACHFADTYSQRLKDCPAHLKIHSYRAALEWLANQLCADFKRTAVQIPSKKSDKMDFECYAKLGLKKLGIEEDRLTADLLAAAEAMTLRWKDVVAFYTLRLSLAPVVETLILLDRMLFLRENGFDSAVMPIFDPNLSPRNFVLLSWKHK